MRPGSNGARGLRKLAHNVILMAEGNCLCTLCHSAKAVTFCCCLGAETFLCETCVPLHYFKTLGRLHMCIPLSAYGQHTRPGYFDRLQERTTAFPRNCQYLRRNLNLIDACIEEFTRVTLEQIAQLQTYMETTLRKLVQLRTTLAEQIEATVSAAEASLTKDSSTGLPSLVVRLRDTEADVLAFQVFDCCFDKTWLQSSLSKTLKYNILLESSGDDLLISVYGNSLRKYNLVKNEQAGQQISSSVYVSDGSFYSPIGGNKILILAVNPTSTKVSELDLVSGQACDWPEMGKARRSPGVLQHGVFIYVFGGDNNDNRSCEKLNRGICQWSPLPQMTKGRASFTPCEHRGQVYLPCVRFDHKSLETFSLEKEIFAVLRVELPFTSSDSVAFICEGELILLSQNSTQMARWKLNSAENFRVSGYFNQSGYALSNTPPIKREKMYYFVSAKSGEVNVFDIEACLLRRL